MARNAPTKVIITSSISDLVSDVNDISFDLGATGRLNTNQDSDVVGAINELHDSLGDALLTTTATQVKEAINEIDAELGTISSGAMGTTASTVSGAIAELDSDRDDLITVVAPNTGITTTATTLTGAINEIDALQGNVSLTTTATTITGAIAELHTEIGDAIGSANNTTTGNIGQSLNLLDSAIGDMTALDANINDRSTLVLAINSLQADIELLDSDTTSFDSKVGSLSSLNAGFTGSERTSVVNALNALYLSIPEIYDENGVQLN
jgi:hypothetical protein